MNIPDASEVYKRLGPHHVIETASHWVTGRLGLTYLVTDHRTGQRSVFKWCSPAEMVVQRDLLPSAPVSTPALYRWWDAEADTLAAVEMECIPELASPEPCYRFSRQYLSLADSRWRTTRLEALVGQIARMHAQYADGAGLGEYSNLFSTCDPATDLDNWQRELSKLSAVALLPGATEWIDFWTSRETSYRRLLAELSAFPRTWIWGDAKWDHVGCYADGTVVLLEWSNLLGPAGSDLYLTVFEPPGRQAELWDLYLSQRVSPTWSKADLERSLRLGLARACYVHGVGQSCLSLRGSAGGGSTARDKAAWAADAATTAQWLQSNGL